MPLQKSFSEQNGSSKTRQRWHKSNTHSGISLPNTRSRPLERVADATKHKLNAFNFCPPADEPDAAKPIKRALVDENDHPIKNDASAPSLPSNLSTPVSRLAWQDLIGDPDAKKEDEDASPQEKIEWDTKHKPAYGVSPMPRKRGSKRARSSSPASSPTAACSRSRAPAVNVKKLSAALKSPRADPSIELWDRFSLSGSTTNTPLGATNPALANFMVSSSPQPKSVGVGRGEAGLRRAISCGTNWPKRRRVERSETAPTLSVAVEESPSRNSKSSMVNALLESVTGELNRSKTAQTRPSVMKSPSPRKKQYNPADHLYGSPKRRLSPSKSTLGQFPGAVNMSREIGISDNSSDYGDDDFDDDTLMGLDVDIKPQVANSSPVPQPQTPTPKQAANPKMTTKGVDTTFDEFGDLDDDIFDNAEELLSQIDSACNTGHRTTTSQAPVSQEPVLDETSEDMYGDDFGGDFDFEAAEIAATQSAKQPNGAVPS
ncbi:hypothetical protein F4860DRAFT_289073 [Xylaria cubensis]|nr:hypothetical protein F4860DRAFT_289073 [Xylaria cubensis]